MNIGMIIPRDGGWLPHWNEALDESIEINESCLFYNVPSVAKKNEKKKIAKFFRIFAKFFRSFFAMGAPPCTKQKIGEIEISLLSNFQLSTTLGAQKNEKKQKLRKPSKYW